MTKSFAFYQKKVSSMKQAHPRDMFKKASKTVWTSTIVAPPDPLPPPPSTSLQLLRLQKTHKRTPMTESAEKAISN
jgi:hypothetical protein